MRTWRSELQLWKPRCSMPAGPTPPQEVELKLEVTPSKLKKVLTHPLLGDRPDGAATQTLHSTYFDTPDHRLQQAGISFRVRRNGDRRIQTVKAVRALDGVALARAEWEHEIDGDGPDFTVVEDTVLKPFLKNSGSIQPVFQVTTERTLRNVRFERSMIEIAADEGRV